MQVHFFFHICFHCWRWHTLLEDHAKKRRRNCSCSCDTWWCIGSVFEVACCVVASASGYSIVQEFGLKVSWELNQDITNWRRRAGEVLWNFVYFWYFKGWCVPSSCSLCCRGEVLRSSKWNCVSKTGGRKTTRRSAALWVTQLRKAQQQQCDFLQLGLPCFFDAFFFLKWLGWRHHFPKEI